MLAAMIDAGTPPLADDECLVLGGSGAVGRFLLRRMALAGQRAAVLSRAPAPVWSTTWRGLRWRRGDLDTLHLPPGRRLVLSAGPLDALARGLPAWPLAAGSRVVALSSMSAVWKIDSPNPAERALADALLASERVLQAHCARASITLVLLRPTLIYGAGIDRSLSPLLRLARRWHRLPWPRAARGRRQPVHADDVAAALLAGAVGPNPAAEPVPLPGGSCLAYDAVIDCLLDRLAPGCRRLPFPVPLPDPLLARLAAGRGRLAATAAQLWRARADQLADPAGWSLFDHRPRAFMPEKADFEPWHAPPP
jgi:hypothetical protein